MRPPISYQDFAVVIEPDGDDGYRARVLPSAGGSAPVAFEPPVEVDRLPELLRSLEGLLRGRDDAPAAAGELRTVRPPRQATAPPGPEELGASLFEALFTGSVRDAYQRRRGLARDRKAGLRLRLVFDPALPGMQPLCALPWELAFDRGEGHFLSLNPKTPIVRYLQRPAAADPHLAPVDRPLRVLVAAASPSEVPPLELEEERRRIEKALRRRDDIHLSFPETPTTEALRRALREEEPHVLHFMGHGTFDETSGEGALLLTTPEDEEDRLTGDDLAVLLSGCDELRLVVLNACEGGALPRRNGLDAFAGVAAALVRSGLPAVAAMQLPVSDEAAIAFAGAFYEYLAAGDPVEAALAEGRQAIYDVGRRSGSMEWATPVLYLQVDDGRIFHFEPRDEPSTLEERILPSDDLIREVTRGFVGRDFVFDAIDEFVAQEECGYFHIQGDPGIGKTALLAELVRLRGYPHHFNIRSDADHNRPEDFLANLCAQLIVRHRLPYTALPAEATHGPAFLSRLLKEVSAGLGGEKAVVLVDALDEVIDAKEESASNILHLPQRLPPGIFFVLAGRRDQKLRLHVKSPLKPFLLKHDSSDNLRDVRVYVEGYVERQGIRDYIAQQGLNEERFVDDMERRSDGNFMYLFHVLPEIEKGAYRARPLEEIPWGLESYYEDHWLRMRELCGEDWYRYQLPVLAALTVAKRPVTLMMMDDFTGISDLARVLAVLLAWDAFLHTVRDPSGSPKRTLYRLYHETFHDFIHRKDAVAAERVDLAGANRKITRLLGGLFQRRQVEA